MRMFKKRSEKDKTVKSESKADVNINNTENIKTEDTKLNEPKTRTPRTRKVNKAVKKYCKIIVATPTYFVIKKDDEIITVNKKNTYCRGEEVLY